MERTTVILAAGTFPRKGTPAHDALMHAAHVVCCDSAADIYRRRTGREPAAVVGDCDSVKGTFARVVRVSEQETNDLDKAIRYCASRGWRNPILLGLTGKRDDHAIGNLFRAMSHGLDIMTDYGRFVPVTGTLTLNVAIGSPVSIFATPSTQMTSTGLEWPLDAVNFENFYCATLNRATASRVVLTTDRPAYAYLPHVRGGRGQ